MKRYIIGRFLQSLLSLIVLLTIVFFSVRFSGDPLNALLAVGSTKEQEAEVRAHYGLDRPLHVQYGIYISQLVRGDLGRSIYSQRPVSELIMGRIGASIELTAAAIAIALTLGLVLGVYCAVKRNRLQDFLGRSFAIAGQSIPVFWLGLMLMLVFAVWLRVLPTSGRGGPTHVILPAVVLGYHLSAGVLRLTRSAMLDVLSSEYIKMARIKGVSERLVIWKHAFRNAMLPVVTYFAVVTATLVGGAIVTETVFAWPGLGQLVVQSATNRDLPVIQGVVLLIGSVVLAANLIVDVLYTYLNPRIRYAK